MLKEIKQVKLGSIVRHTPTGLIYEVVLVAGYSALCKDINPPYSQIALLNKDLDVIIEEGSDTEAFDILFKKGTNS